jgi:hypothetical protein
MRVAVCMPGFPRILDFCYPYLEEYIMCPLKADLFFYGYSDIQNGWSADRILSILSPKRYIIREFDEEVKSEIWGKYGGDVVNTPVSPEPINVLSQYYNMFKCFELIEDEYDVVIRVRPDYFICRDLTEIDSIEANTVYIPNLWDFGGVSSGYAHGDYSSMETYCNFFNKILDYNRGGVRFHCETMKRHHIYSSGLTRQVIPPPYWWELEDFEINGYGGSYINGMNRNPSRRNYR